MQFLIVVRIRAATGQAPWGREAPRETVPATFPQQEKSLQDVGHLSKCKRSQLCLAVPECEAENHRAGRVLRLQKRAAPPSSILVQQVKLLLLTLVSHRRTLSKELFAPLLRIQFPADVLVGGRGEHQKMTQGPGCLPPTQETQLGLPGFQPGQAHEE